MLSALIRLSSRLRIKREVHVRISAGRRLRAEAHTQVKARASKGLLL